jgi:drug/metabolite transporter (DMT)-like permease
VTNSEKIRLLTQRISGQVYLWLAILIFGASSAVTQKITQIGADHFIGGHNPISLCNVLFVGNLCALFVLILIYREQLSRATLQQTTGKQWLGLIAVAILAGALAPGMFFLALSQTSVNNVVLIGRLEPPLTLALSIWFLRERINVWAVAGAIAAFVGVTLTIALQPPAANMINMGGFSVGMGEFLTAAAAVALAAATIIGKKRLSRVPLGLYSIFRTALGTVIFFFLALILYGKNHFQGAFSPFLWQWMLLYGALIVVVGQSFWIAGLRASTLSEASLVASCTPIMGILAAYFILSEVPTSAQYIGGSVILAGLFLGQIGAQSQRSQSEMMTEQNSMQTEQALETQIGFKGR